MKYSVKVDIFNQKDVNAGQAPSGSTLPVKVESVQAYSVVTDILTSGSTLYTPAELCTQLRGKFNITATVSESISLNGVDIVTTDPLTGRSYKYKAVLPISVLVSGSI